MAAKAEEFLLKITQKTFFYKINQVVGSHQTSSNTMQNVCYVHIFNHATYYMKFETRRVDAQISFPQKCFGNL